MSIVRLVAVAALVLPGAVFASNTFNVATSTCTGSLVSSYTNGVSFACTGDFSLSNGSIESDTSILLSATGSMWLANISLTAPTITLNAADQLVMAEGTFVDLASGAQPIPVGGTNTLIPLKGRVEGGGILQIREPERDISQSAVRPVINWESYVISSGGTVHLQQPGTIQLGTVPEPGSVALMVAGLMAIGLMARKGSKA